MIFILKKKVNIDTNMEKKIIKPGALERNDYLSN